jgi:hypothetical protein
VDGVPNLGHTEERKRIAAEIRRAAKREKKLVKADAKRQRKLNAIMHRRMVHTLRVPAFTIYTFTDDLD